ncbi:MAG: PhzF family phenazine biosynthesis protein [Nitrospinae bacterium]|nr:PhzF family phenazine biosynthesis protein [Nitrospinota bacterium]
MTTVQCAVARVFTNKGKNGNLLGVVTGIAGLTDGQMQRIARTLGYSETSFVFFDTRKGDYRVRFFTPEKEIPFAGHPTIGTLFTLRELGLVKKKKNYVQVIGPRRIPLEVLPNGAIWMDQGKPSFSPACTRNLAARLVGAKESDVIDDPMAVSTGIPVLVIPLASRRALGAARILDPVYQSVFKKYRTPCIMPFAVDKGQVYSRSFVPGFGIAEDPATGGATGPLAAYIAHRGMIAHNETKLEFTVLQGGRAKSELLASVSLTRGKVKSAAVGGYCAMERPRRIEVPFTPPRG